MRTGPLFTVPPGHSATGRQRRQRAVPSDASIVTGLTGVSVHNEIWAIGPRLFHVELHNAFANPTFGLEQLGDVNGVEVFLNVGSALVLLCH